MTVATTVATTVRTIATTNSLIILLPDPLFSPSILPLFEAHFSLSYGSIISWTALPSLGRVLVIYKLVESAINAKLEMDGFVWDEDDEVETDQPTSCLASGSSLDPPRSDREPIRVFFGPPLSPAASDPIKVTLLLVPSLSKNFLISPPGSPPVGWEQILEEAPNTKALHESLVLLDERDGEEKEGWASELDRALRFLSVGVEDEDVVDDTTQRSQPSTTHTIIASERASLRPAVTLSTPSFSFSSPSPFSDATTTPPPGAAKITAVKATIESMLGRKRSYSDFGPAERIELGNIINPPTHLSLSSTIAPRIIPTARPPTESIDEYIES